MYKRYYTALSKNHILLTVQSIIITPSEKYDPQKALGTDRTQMITPIYACTNSINKNARLDLRIVIYQTSYKNTSGYSRCHSVSFTRGKLLRVIRNVVFTNRIWFRLPSRSWWIAADIRLVWLSPQRVYIQETMKSKCQCPIRIKQSIHLYRYFLQTLVWGQGPGSINI